MQLQYPGSVEKGERRVRLAQWVSWKVLEARGLREVGEHVYWIPGVRKVEGLKILVGECDF